MIHFTSIGGSTQSMPINHELNGKVQALLQ